MSNAISRGLFGKAQTSIPPQIYSACARGILAALMLLHIIIPFAHAETVPIEGVGTGQTREAAVNAALADAVRQATDTEVSSSSKARLTERDQSIKVDGAEQATSALTSDTDRKIQSESEGNVAGYTVMAEQQDPATGEWRGGLLANVVRFAPVGNAEIQALIKMAIIPFRWAVVEQPGNDQAPKDFTSYLDGAIQAYFTQSRQFNVSRQKIYFRADGRAGLCFCNKPAGRGTNQVGSNACDRLDFDGRNIGCKDYSHTGSLEKPRHL
jgi:hypothetical protein